MNKRKFIISTGAFLMLVMLITGYLASDAVMRGEKAPYITEEYKNKVLTPPCKTALVDLLEKWHISLS